MIARVWHGWTTPEQADTYDTLLREEVFPGILARGIAGFQRIELYRRPLGAEVEFMTVMWFDLAEAIAAFAGTDPEAAYVPDAARRVLSRFDQRAAHLEFRHGRLAGEASAAPAAAVPRQGGGRFTVP